MSRIAAAINTDDLSHRDTLCDSDTVRALGLTSIHRSLGVLIIEAKEACAGESSHDATRLRELISAVTNIVSKQAKRDRLASGLRRAGFDVLVSEGTYFLTARVPPGWNGSDDAFCRYLTTEAGVACIPLGSFYEGAEDAGYIRFCFCKRDEVLDEAAARLARHFARMEVAVNG